jgi:hypothetical protein
MLGATDVSCLAQGETFMELLTGMPEWLVWCAAGAVGAIALAALASILDVALELDAG